MSERLSFSQRVQALAKGIEKRFRRDIQQPLPDKQARFLKQQHDEEHAALTRAVIEASLGFDEPEEQLDHKTPMRRIF